MSVARHSDGPRSQLDRSTPRDAPVEPSSDVVRMWDVEHMTRERRSWQARVTRPHQPDTARVATTRLTLEKDLPMSPTPLRRALAIAAIAVAVPLTASAITAAGTGGVGPVASLPGVPAQLLAVRSAAHP